MHWRNSPNDSSSLGSANVLRNRGPEAAWASFLTMALTVDSIVGWIFAARASARASTRAPPSAGASSTCLCSRRNFVVASSASSSMTSPAVLPP